MTGIFVRVQRPEGMVNVEFDQLTDSEMHAFVKTQDPADGWLWAVSLAKWIRENVKTQE